MIIDRITETQVYIEDDDGAVRAFPRSMLPEDAREGDVLRNTGGVWRVDAEKTKERRNRMKKRLERLIK